jgi:hypothetical protein
MNHNPMKTIYLLLLISLFCENAFAQEDAKNDSIMITIMLKHHQDKNIDELIKIRESNGFTENFPPESAKVVSWYVMMGIGQVVTVKLPASELRTLNMSVEKSVWGAFSTEFYPTYDLYPIIAEKKAQLKAQKEE